MPRPPRSLRREMEDLQDRISEIQELRTTVKTQGWRQLVRLFQAEIDGYAQSIIDLCDNPKKNDFEIRVKKFMAGTFRKILISVDGRLANENFLKDQLDDRAAQHAAEIESKKLKQL